ncbi:MAG: hypothetical protein LQ351_006995 [Letrouitia transgressa]|nr:MAG: hypothetical protein LQ351_006995 [Letrouitia transgressa]
MPSPSPDPQPALSDPPFSKSAQLNTDLVFFRRLSHLSRTDDPQNTRLPSQPRIQLNSPELLSYVSQDLQTAELDSFAPYLWLLSTPSYINISPLHHQLVKGRTIVLTEDPQLHLLWIWDRIFVKPVPEYLLSHAFWECCFGGNGDTKAPWSPEAREKVFKAACGFLRSWALLIRYKSDFAIAMKDGEGGSLLPRSDSSDGEKSGGTRITYEAFCEFIAPFADMVDDQVSPRYRYGEIRLSRLKIWSKIFMRSFHFEQFYGHYGTYFGRFYGPLLFLFGVLSVVLSAMQVELGVSAGSTEAGNWVVFESVCRWFSIVTILLVAASTLVLLTLLVKMVAGEVFFATRSIYRKRRRKVGNV